MALLNQLKPRVIVYDIQRKERFRHLEKDFKVTYSDPHYFKVPEMKYDYYWSDRERICDEYRRYTGVPHIDTLSKESNSEVVEDAVQKQAEEVEQQKEEVASEEPAVEKSEDTLESLSWHELRAKAQAAGLEGRFNKEEALEFLCKQ